MKENRTHVDSVAVAGVEGVGGEQFDYVPQARDFELFRLLLDDFAVKGVDQRGRVEEHGAYLGRAFIIIREVTGNKYGRQLTVGQVDLALADGGEVVLGDAGLADRPRREV